MRLVISCLFRSLPFPLQDRPWASCGITSGRGVTCRSRKASKALRLRIVIVILKLGWLEGGGPLWLLTIIVIIELLWLGGCSSKIL